MTSVRSLCVLDYTIVNHKEMLDIITTNPALWVGGWMDKQRQKKYSTVFLVIYGQSGQDLKPLFCLKHSFVRSDTTVLKFVLFSLSYSQWFLSWSQSSLSLLSHCMCLSFWVFSLFFPSSSYTQCLSLFFSNTYQDLGGLTSRHHHAQSQLF